MFIIHKKIAHIFSIVDILTVSLKYETYKMYYLYTPYIHACFLAFTHLLLLTCKYKYTRTHTHAFIMYSFVKLMTLISRRILSSALMLKLFFRYKMFSIPFFFPIPGR